MALLRTLIVHLAVIASVLALQPFHTWGHERIQLQDVSIHFRYSEGGKPPLLLVHGSPQHSLTWLHIGPILAENFTVIAPDNRGQGDSSLSPTENYTAPAGGEDLRAILNFLNITKTFVFAHDKGVGLATSLALEHPELIERLILAEYPLPGYGYSTEVTSPNIYYNWQLAFFAVPDAAQFFVQGREKEMLAWYFFHGSYSGNDVISNDLLETYTRNLAKPGFLRAMFQYFAAAFSDAEYFKSKISAGKLQMPLLAMGGEASFAPAALLRKAFEPVAADLTVAVIPKAGHWIVSQSRITRLLRTDVKLQADENPAWSANKALEFFHDTCSVPSIDLSWLENTITMFGAFETNQITAGTNDTTQQLFKRGS